MPFEENGVVTGYMIQCPACGNGHLFNTTPSGSKPVWTFNGDLEKPTFSPSMLVRSGCKAPGHKPGDPCWCSYNKDHPGDPAPFGCGVCHSFVRAGRIEFLGDCTHRLAGQTVDLPAWDSED